MITIKQVKRLTMTLSWGSLVKPQQMEKHLPRMETSDPACRCSTLTTLSGPFFTNKPKVAFLSWHDPGFSSCGPSCVPDEKVKLLAQTALVNATSLEKYRHLPRNQTSEEGGTLQSPPMSYGGESWTLAARSIDHSIDKSWESSGWACFCMFSTPAGEYIQKASFVLLAITDYLCDAITKFLCDHKHYTNMISLK